jgi:hypothetical protein
MQGSATARTEAMQCVDTAFAHAAFDDRGSTLPRCEFILASGGAPKRSNDAAIATAQTALRIGTRDRRLIPPPEGVFYQHSEPFEFVFVFNFLHSLNLTKF